MSVPSVTVLRYILLCFLGAKVFPSNYSVPKSISQTALSAAKERISKLPLKTFRCLKQVPVKFEVGLFSPPLYWITAKQTLLISSLCCLRFLVHIFSLVSWWKKLVQSVYRKIQQNLLGSCSAWKTIAVEHAHRNSKQNNFSFDDPCNKTPSFYKIIMYLLLLFSSYFAVLSHSVLPNSLGPHGLYVCSPPGSFVHGDSPGKKSGVGCHAFLQEIFPTQGLNSGLLHCKANTLPSEPSGNPENTRVSSLSLLQKIFLTHESNWSRPRCRWSL